MPVSIPHITAIDAVLHALPPDLTPAHAFLVLEDAAAALLLGAQFGLTLEAIARNHAELLTEIATEVRNSGTGRPRDS